MLYYLSMIPHKAHHKGFKKKDPREAWKRKAPKPKTVKTTPMRQRGKSNRSKERSGHQEKMCRVYPITGICVWPGCKSSFGNAHAHRLKKRFILTEGEWVHGQVELCQSHHHFAEYGDRKHRGTHRRMYRLITLLMRKLGRPIK